MASRLVSVSTDPPPVPAPPDEKTKAAVIAVRERMTAQPSPEGGLGCEMSGWLYKQSIGRPSRPSRRWFALKGDSLTYSDNNLSANHPKGSTHLPSCIMTDAADCTELGFTPAWLVPRLHTAFSLRDTSSGDEVLLFAETQEEKSSWMLRLAEKCCQEAEADTGLAGAGVQFLPCRCYGLCWREPWSPQGRPQPVVACGIRAGTLLHVVSLFLAILSLGLAVACALLLSDLHLVWWGEFGGVWAIYCIMGSSAAVFAVSVMGILGYCTRTRCVLEAYFIAEIFLFLVLMFVSLSLLLLTGTVEDDVVGSGAASSREAFTERIEEHLHLAGATGLAMCMLISTSIHAIFQLLGPQRMSKRIVIVLNTVLIACAIVFIIGATWQLHSFAELKDLPAHSFLVAILIIGCALLCGAVVGTVGGINEHALLLNAYVGFLWVTGLPLAVMAVVLFFAR